MRNSFITILFSAKSETLKNETSAIKYVHKTSSFQKLNFFSHLFMNKINKYKNITGLAVQN